MEGAGMQRLNVSVLCVSLIEESRDEEDLGELRNLVFQAELSSEANDLFHFTDEDGGALFLRASDVAVIEIPLWAVEPELLDEREEQGKAVDQA